MLHLKGGKQFIVAISNCGHWASAADKPVFAFAPSLRELQFHIGITKRSTEIHTFGCADLYHHLLYSRHCTSSFLLFQIWKVWEIYWQWHSESLKCTHLIYRVYLWWCEFIYLWVIAYWLVMHRFFYILFIEVLHNGWIFYYCFIKNFK